MLTTDLHSQTPPLPFAARPAMASPRTAPPVAHQPAEAEGLQARRIGDMLKMLGDTLQPQKRIVHASDVLYRAGARFDCLHVLNSGMVKVVKFTADGREQVVALKFRGDWLGLDGIARGTYGCDGIAMDTGEVWSFRYDALLNACGSYPALLGALHGAMSQEIGRERESLMSVCTLPADARVADFLRFFAESLESRGLRTDQITLRMTRAEIGNYLGLTLESVSRALSRLARDRLIAFMEKGRREVHIPDVRALTAFVHRCVAPEAVVLQ